MQRRPDRTALLDAVAQFLLTELHPSVTDKRLSFRVLIAANLAGIVSAELKASDAQASAELERLEKLLPAATSEGTRDARLERLNRALSGGLRSGKISSADPAVRAHLRQTLLDALAVTNPRFDVSPDLE